MFDYLDSTIDAEVLQTRIIEKSITEMNNIRNTTDIKIDTLKETFKTYTYATNSFVSIAIILIVALIVTIFLSDLSRLQLLLKARINKKSFKQSNVQLHKEEVQITVKQRLIDERILMEKLKKTHRKFQHK